MAGLDTNLKNQVALVTGGSQGIGAATAIALGRAGAALAITYNRSRVRAMEVLAEVEKAGVLGIALALDLRDETSIRTMVSQTMERFGRIDILVNNAAVGSASVAERRLTLMRTTHTAQHVMRSGGETGGRKGRIVMNAAGRQQLRSTRFDVVPVIRNRWHKPCFDTFPIVTVTSDSSATKLRSGVVSRRVVAGDVPYISRLLAKW